MPTNSYTSGWSSRKTNRTRKRPPRLRLRASLQRSGA
nr:MAG TPA: hypothetical protein [Caudoviricetes sp.]